MHCIRVYKIGIERLPTISKYRNLAFANSLMIAGSLNRFEQQSIDDLDAPEHRQAHEGSLDRISLSGEPAAEIKTAFRSEEKESN